MATPSVQAIVLCDDIETDLDTNDIQRIVGVYHRIIVESFPAVVPMGWIFLQIVSPEEDGEIQYAICEVFEHPAEVQEMTVSTTIARKPVNTVIEATQELPRLSVDGPAYYRIMVRWNGTEIARRDVAVIERSDA